MKNLFLAATAALALFASCSKDSDVITDVKGGVVKVSFVDEPSTSRAFFGATAAAEAWEKNLSSVTMFVFDATGDLITRRAFNSSELAAKTATFALPGVSPGDDCDFYAVANLSGITGTLCKRAIKIVKGEAFTRDDLDKCRIEIMHRYKEYEKPFSLCESIAYMAEGVVLSFWGKHKSVLNRYPVILDFEDNNGLYYYNPDKTITHRWPEKEVSRECQQFICEINSVECLYDLLIQQNRGELK